MTEASTEKVAAEQVGLQSEYKGKAYLPLVPRTGATSRRYHHDRLDGGPRSPFCSSGCTQGYIGEISVIPGSKTAKTETFGSL